MTDISADPVLAIEDARFRAMEANDFAALDSLLPDSLHYVHANGIIENKVEFIRKLASGERRYKKFEVIRRTIRREGDFAFVFGEAAVEVDRTAGPLRNNLTYTAIYRDGPTPEFFAWHAVKTYDA